jgi:hypothetical protein
MSAAIEIPKSTELSRLDEQVGKLRSGALVWAQMKIGERIEVARRMLKGYVAIAEQSVIASCAAKGIPMGTPQEGEEWLGGPYVTIRILRLTIEALGQIRDTGNTKIGKTHRGIDGKLVVQNYPLNTMDKLMFGGLSAETVLEAGVDEKQLEENRASFYKKPTHEGRVALILGAGNVNSIPPTDVITKLFNEGKVCILKMNPVNAYMGPFIAEAFKELIDRGFLSVVYGGGEEGAYLCKHAGVDEIHITGSDKTHDMIVWGPPGPERAERMARNKPLLDKEITSELGNVSPVIVVPGAWDDKSLAFQADAIAGAMTNNASFNCNAMKMMVTAKGWSQTPKLQALIMEKAATAPTRKAWYPGAQQRYAGLVEGREIATAGPAGEGQLPWTMIKGIDASNPEDRALTTEPFCSIISSTELGNADDPVKFLEAAVAFANDKLWGTLSASLVVHPSTLADPKGKEAVEWAIARLRYGAVGVNIWPAAAFALGTTPWGAYPGSTLTNIQSGRGFVHNTAMIEGIEKCVLRYPTVASPKPPILASHKSANVLGRRVTYFEESPSYFKLPPIIAAALKG